MFKVMGKYRLVVFDWEGTLGDSLGQLIHTLSLVSEKMDYGYLDKKQARQVVGSGLVLAVKRLFPQLTEQQQSEILVAVQQEMAAQSAQAYLFPGARELLERLNQKHILLAIATNCGQKSLQTALSSLDLSAQFAVTRSASEAPPKPCPQMLEEIIAFCGVTADETLMIGDSTSDMEMALAAEVDAIGVDFYHQHEDNLLQLGAMKVFDRYEQLAQFLKV